ncbi:acetylcholine receptor subunit beta-type unc-29-like isoform X2 [Atheta coriaria]|uniref:acetylcholine receptor subunit beta-type unc-29-like isoform X2 n=1 Tax=Dalotia coriaria TaxID=877792 RepID=UPI0031F46189
MVRLKMCSQIKSLFLFICVIEVNGKFYKENVTNYNDCKIYYTRFEGGYNTFFDLAESEDPELLVDLHIAVLAVSEAHILLATSADVKANDPAYEIVIGAGGNTFSDIRRKQKASVRVSYRKKGLLSAVDITGFWIHIYRNGLIDVGKDGEEVAFMSWQDTELLPVTVFTLAGWRNVEIKWFYDCPRPNANVTDTKKRFSTEIDRLREDVLNIKESHNDNVKVNIQLTSQYVSLDEKQSILNLKGRANFSWNFNPIRWNPENYSNIKTVLLQHNEIWKPEITVSNGIDLDHLQPFIGNTLIANHDGQILWQPSFDISTFCSLNGIENWPNDVHECEIYLSTPFWQNNYVRFAITAPSDTIQLTANNYDSEWYIEEGPNIHIYQLSNPKNSPDIYIRMPQSLKLRITIKRRTIITVMMLMNFWCSPFDYMKVSIIAAQFLLTSMASIGLAIVLPGHREIIPIIVYRYSAVMLANILNLIISVIVINLSRNKQLFEPAHIIGRIVKSKLVEKLLLLPELAPQVSCAYPAAMETTRRRTRVQDVWIRLGMCIDRLAFIIYLMLTITSFFTK